MENSLAYTLFIRDFAESILLSLNNDYNEYIKFNKNDGILKSKLDYHDIDTTISHIAYSLLLKGKQRIYLYDTGNKIIISLSYYNNEKMIGNFKIKFPNNVINNFRRKKILNQLKKMVYPYSDKYKDASYSRDMLFIMDLIKKKSDRITRKYLSVNNHSEKCTDQYILFREIRKRKYQKMLVDHIFNELNKQLHLYLNICDKEDNIFFESQSLEELNLMEQDLLNNNKKISEILKILYPWRYK